MKLSTSSESSWRPAIFRNSADRVLGRHRRAIGARAVIVSYVEQIATMREARGISLPISPAG